MSWTYRAACADEPKATFFPPRGGDKGKAAKAICAVCPVTAECLDEALALPYHHDAEGVRGGKSARERRRMRYPVETEQAS